MLAYEWKMLNQPKKAIAISTKRFNIFPYESTLEIWKKEKKKEKKKRSPLIDTSHIWCVLYLCWKQFKLFTKGLTRKRRNFRWYLSKLLRIKLPACEKIFVIPTIGIAITNTTKKKPTNQTNKQGVKFVYLFLNSWNSEILIWNCLISFSKINQCSAKKGVHNRVVVGRYNNM